MLKNNFRQRNLQVYSWSGKPKHCWAFTERLQRLWECATGNLTTKELIIDLGLAKYDIEQTVWNVASKTDITSYFRKYASELNRIKDTIIKQKVFVYQMPQGTDDLAPGGREWQQRYVR